MMKLAHGPLCAQHLQCLGRVQPGPENFAHSACSVDVGPYTVPLARSTLAVDPKWTVVSGSRMNKTRPRCTLAKPSPHSLPRLLNHHAAPSDQICRPVSVHRKDKKTEPTTPSRAPRRCARPPLGGRATIEWPHGGVSLRLRASLRW
jgi:hypothetical protein